ncbi:hypothetical protein [Enterococcus faecalis]|uniref:hypothetical protein n=1 Tax=Enterococcus faecalis TaxID=1351 RepID=UPI003CE4E608
MTYNTGNPVPSTDPRDLLDNTQALDGLVNGALPAYPDRKRVARKSWAGMEADFAAAQGDKEQRFQAFLLASGYVDLGDYAAGLVLAERNQVFRREGELYRAAAALELPYTLTGDWAVDGPQFVSVGDAVLRQDLSQDAGWIGYVSPLAGAVRRSLGSRLSDTVSVKDFGAIGDGLYHPLSERFGTLSAAQLVYPFVTSLEQSIDWAAIQAALNAAVMAPCHLHFEGSTYLTTDTLIWKGGAFLRGVPGRTRIKLAPGANCTVFESAQFDHWAAWSVGESTDGYPMDGGVDGLLFDGSGDEQGDVSTTLETLVYGVRVLSHRFQIGWLQVTNVKGVGVLTQYNSALVYSLRIDGYDDSGGMFGDFRGTPSPFEFGSINITDTLYESFVFNGPGDIPIHHLTTNYCGWLGSSQTAPTTPRTSLLFAGEEIHSVRIQTACKIGYLNGNNALYGRGLYVAPFVRFHGDTVIASGSWGGLLIEGSAFGSIAALSIQHNSFAWGGTYRPGLELTYGTGSAGGKNRFSFPQVSVRRLTTPADPYAIGPAILDNAGAQFGIIDGVDSNPVAGHGLVIGATNRGGIYESVNFDSLQGTAHDGTVSAAILIESGARDWRIDLVRLTNCARSIVNLGANMRGIVREGVIELNGAAGQIALSGVVSDSQLASVVAGAGSIARDNLPHWRLEILDDSVRYFPAFQATQTFSMGGTGSFAGAALQHRMWRAPAIHDVSVSSMWGGTTWPEFKLGIRSITASEITLAGFVYTAQSGTLRVGIEI